MGDDQHELIAMAKEQGRLAGLVEGVRDDVSEIKTEQAKLRECLGEQCNEIKKIETQIGVIAKTMTESGIRPAVKTPPEPTTLLTVLKGTLTPSILVIVALIIVIVILVAGLTGRNTTDFIPVTHEMGGQEKQ